MLYHRVAIAKGTKATPIVKGMPHIYNSIEIKGVK